MDETVKKIIENQSLSPSQKQTDSKSKIGSGANEVSATAQFVGEIEMNNKRFKHVNE